MAAPELAQVIEHAPYVKEPVTQDRVTGSSSWLDTSVTAGISYSGLAWFGAEGGFRFLPWPWGQEPYPVRDTCQCWWQ
jgi:hypothetical protein